jgi:hypothetical protein
VFTFSTFHATRGVVHVASPAERPIHLCAHCRGEASNRRARYLRKMRSARMSQANPTKSIMKKAVPSVVAAMLEGRECRTLFISWSTLIQPVQRTPDEDEKPTDF